MQYNFDNRTHYGNNEIKALYRKVKKKNRRKTEGVDFFILKILKKSIEFEIKMILK